MRIQHLISKGEPYEYSLVTEGIGRLKIHSFGIGSSNDFNLFLDRIFRRIEKDQIHSLIIDVRGNTGGANFGVSDLLHRLTTKYFKVAAISEMKVSQSFRDYYQYYLPQVNFYRIMPLRTKHSYSIAELYRKDIGEFIVEKETHNEAPKNLNYRFAGDLYLLVDGRTFSAAACLAASFRCYQLGLIIGTPTGGTRIFHANNMYKELHAVNLICTMSTTRVYTSCFGGEEENIIPDIHVEPTIHHLLADRDAAIDYVVHLARKVQKMRDE
jgi:C-terminal processing protease CtpA/Prc